MFGARWRCDAITHAGEEETYFRFYLDPNMTNKTVE